MKMCHNLDFSAVVVVGRFLFGRVRCACVYVCVCDCVCASVSFCYGHHLAFTRVFVLFLSFPTSIFMFTGVLGDSVYVFHSIKMS